MKGCGSHISDIEVYRRAARFYFPNSEVEFVMTITIVGDEPDEKYLNKEPKKKPDEKKQDSKEQKKPESKASKQTDRQGSRKGVGISRGSPGTCSLPNSFVHSIVPSIVQIPPCGEILAW